MYTKVTLAKSQRKISNPSDQQSQTSHSLPNSNIAWIKASKKGTATQCLLSCPVKYLISRIWSYTNLICDLFDHVDAGDFSGIDNFQRSSIETTNVLCAMENVQDYAGGLSKAHEVQIVQLNDGNISPSRFQDGSSIVEYYSYPRKWRGNRRHAGFRAGIKNAPRIQL